jgi:outer membrane protein assembly factor BamB
VKDGARAVALSLDAYMAGSAAAADSRAYFGTFNNEVVAIDLKGRRVAWRFSDPARHFPFYSSPAIAGGTVFIGGRDRYVRALDAGSGKPRWAFMTRARVDSSPVVADTRVVVGSSDGVLYVLDAATGKEIWQFEAGAAFLASPAVAAGRIVIGDTDGRVYGIGQ